MSDRAHFDRARFTVLGESYGSGGIGTYSEKSLHRILKLWLEENEEYHEVKFLGSVADIKTPERIYEIQTRGFKNLCPKLKKFLTEAPVTVVYPLPYEKYIRWIDRDSGEISERKKSPKRSVPLDAVYELYNIREFLSDNNFSLKLIFLNVDEFRYRGGRIIGKERRSVRAECIPISVERVIDLKRAEDYEIFIPEKLPESFTANSFNTAVGKRFRYGYSAIQILRAVGLVTEGEKIGRKTVYSLVKN